jgi:hypothetical protein
MTEQAAIGPGERSAKAVGPATSGDPGGAAVNPVYKGRPGGTEHAATQPAGSSGAQLAIQLSPWRRLAL